MKLGEQGSLNSCARFVVWPHTVAKRFDDVIGGYGDVRRIVFDHLRNHVEDAGHGAERRISFLEAANAVKVTKEVVGGRSESMNIFVSIYNTIPDLRFTICAGLRPPTSDLRPLISESADKHEGHDRDRALRSYHDDQLSLQ